MGIYGPAENTIRELLWDELGAIRGCGKILGV